METKEFKTYEMNPPLTEEFYVIFEDYKSAQVFDQVLETCINDIRARVLVPVFMDNQRWARVKSECNVYPDQYEPGIKIIVPNPRRHDKLKRTHDRTLWNRYMDFRDSWEVAYVGYFSEIGCSKHSYTEFYYSKDKAEQFELDAWKSYLSESEKFKEENNFNWAYLERFSPGIMKSRLIYDCFNVYIHSTQVVKREKLNEPTNK
jgi:hypothetical protein